VKSFLKLLSSVGLNVTIDRTCSTQNELRKKCNLPVESCVEVGHFRGERGK
jgi:hypothetical protein